jgi:hypothetical protein
VSKTFHQNQNNVETGEEAEKLKKKTTQFSAKMMSLLDYFL